MANDTKNIKSNFLDDLSLHQDGGKITKDYIHVHELGHH